MENDEQAVLEMFRYICVNNKWKDFFGKTRQAVMEQGPNLLLEIDKKFDKFQEKRNSFNQEFGRNRFNQGFGRNRYGGTNLTNYRLRQMATYEGTPSQRNFDMIGSGYW